MIMTMLLDGLYFNQTVKDNIRKCVEWVSDCKQHAAAMIGMTGGCSPHQYWHHATDKIRHVVSLLLILSLATFPNTL